jgi:hypothetical protein
VHELQTEHPVIYKTAPSSYLMNRNRKYCNFIPGQQPKPEFSYPLAVFESIMDDPYHMKRNNTDAF